MIYSFTHQENVFLDSDLHCQIADFGLAQPSEDSTVQSDAALLNYSAPELLSVYDKCPTDVYAFGCLYYAVSLLTCSAHLMVICLDIFSHRAFQ